MAPTNPINNSYASYQQQKFNSGKYRPEDVNLHTIDTENIKQ